MRRAVLFVSCFFLPAVVLAAGPTFTVVDLGPGPTGPERDWGLSWSIGPRCEAEGAPALDGLNLTTYTCGSNAAGQVGYSPVEPPPNNAYVHAFLLRGPGFTGPPVDLGVFNANGLSWAYGLNPAGTVVVGEATVGPATDISQPSHAFLWESGGMGDLGTFKNGNYADYYSAAIEVNDATQVVGYSENLLSSGEIAFRAALWEKGQIYELQYQLVGVKVNSVILTNAVGISCSGQIAAVGYAANAPTVSRTYLLIPTQAQACK